MVSAAKLRKSQAAVLAVRPFMRKIDGMILNVGGSVDHPYLQERDVVKKVCYLVIGSDRGLCGGFNGNLNRFLEDLLSKETRKFCVVVVGKRARDFCFRCGYDIDMELVNVDDTPTFTQTQSISALLLRLFDNGGYDEINMVYSEFKSPMLQVPMVKRLLPVAQPEPDDDVANLNAEYIFEPKQEDILAALLPQYVDISVYCAVQEAKASEHGARMTAMSAATDNANDMISRLTLSLNRARQAAITTEISEIVGGANALS